MIRAAPAPPAPWWRRRGIPAALLLALLALALALRLKGVAWGLPYSFVNVDESTVLPKAFAAARGHLDPRFFYYPSLFFYLVGGLYLLATPVLWALRGANPLAEAAFVVDPTPYFLIGRLLSVALGTASVYLVYRIGRAAFGRPAGLLAALFLAVAPLHVAYSHMAVTDVAATAFSLAAFWLFLETARGRGRRWLVAGAVAAGLATSTKYNLGLLVLPATVAAVYAVRTSPGSVTGPGALPAAAGPRAWARLLVARVYAPMLAAFLAGSPFVVLDAPRFLHDFARQSRIQERGWLGYEHAGNGLWYNLHPNLTGTLGVVLLVLAVAGLALALWRRTPLDLLAAPYVLAYYVYIGTWSALADRYLLPVVPLLCLFAARLVAAGAAALAGGSSRGRRRLALAAAAALVVAALVAPLAGALRFDAGLSGTDTRLVAKRWIEHNITAGAVIASDSYGPQLVRLSDAPHFRAAGVAVVPYRLLRLQLPVPGEPDLRHSFAWLDAQEVRYVVTASTVSDRVFAAAEHYPRLAAFYRRLDATRTLLVEIAPGSGERGPVLRIYRLERESR